MSCPRLSTYARSASAIRIELTELSGTVRLGKMYKGSLPANMQAADIEKFALWSLDPTGWNPDLWFPKIRREHINFPPEPTDFEVHDALFRLIRNDHFKEAGL
jgi:hypothetical protein